MPDNYDPKEAEPRLQKFWEKENIYKFDPKSTKKIFSIDTPPPTVSGKMHVGHAYSYTQQDTIARFKRMRGYNVFFPFGTDDNGLPTERLIEKMKDVKAKDMERKAFVRLCMSTLKEILPDFISDWKRIGMSCDWSIYYSTIDEHSQRISQRSFIHLYKQGREYQKEAPTIWCPECQTAIAQAELKDKEIQSTFNDLIFKIGKQSLAVATTRPELLPSCVALFYNPHDERYKNLKGKKAKVPMFDFEVPILEDENVNPSKGTGLVMCCTFGDQTDIDWWKNYNLPLKISIDKKGNMNELAGKYEGLSIKKARKTIIEDLKKEGLLVKQQPIAHIVNVHERCDTEIEFLVTKQWFIKYLDLKEKFIELGKELKWSPEFMRVRYENWIKGLKWDWCISRQRYFGVPFPVWYCKKCGDVILADENILPVDPLTDKPPVKECPRCKGKYFVPEQDVLDTWATSSLTPRLSVELMTENVKRKLYPMSLRPQAHEIISFWLFNSIVKSWLHYKTLPWENAMISGYVLDPLGEKMSKSKGNVIAPQDMMNKYCADALRFAACASKLGEDVPFQEKELVAGNKLITKMWNAAKFVSMHLDKKPKEMKMSDLEDFDKWMFIKMNKLIGSCTEAFDKYDYSRTKNEVENFFWHTLCDNYLEIIKDRIYNRKEGKGSAQFTLYYSLLNSIKLLAPIMPHITEEIYQIYFKKNEKAKSIHISEWPKAEKTLDEIEKIGDRAIQIISLVRKLKSTNGKSLKAPVIITLEKKEHDMLKGFMEDLKAVTAAKEIKTGKFEIKLVE